MIPRAVEEKEATKAAENLSKKTGVIWKVGKDHNGLFCLSFNGVQDGDHSTFREKIKKCGIGYNPDTSMTTLRGMMPGKIHDIAGFSHPLEIQAMAQDKFTFPKLTPQQLSDAASKLTSETGLQWIVSENEISLADPRVKLNNNEDPEDFLRKINKILKDCGVMSVNIFECARMRGWEKNGYIIVNVGISHPLELISLSTLKPQAEQKKEAKQGAQVAPKLNDFNPIKTLSGVRMNLGATAASLLLPDGIPREQAEKGKGIAFIELSEKEGMTLHFADENYAQKLAAALKVALGDDNIQYQPSKIGNKFNTEYRGAIQFKDHKKIIQFIENICKYGRQESQDLYNAVGFMPAELTSAKLR